MADRKKTAEEIARLVAEGALGQMDDTAVVPAKTKAEDSESGDDSKLRRRKMGNTNMPEKNLEVVLPDELQDSSKAEARGQPAAGSLQEPAGQRQG